MNEHERWKKERMLSTRCRGNKRGSPLAPPAPHLLPICTRSAGRLTSGPLLSHPLCYLQPFSAASQPAPSLETQFPLPQAPLAESKIGQKGEFWSLGWRDRGTKAGLSSHLAPAPPLSGQRKGPERRAVWFKVPWLVSGGAGTQDSRNVLRNKSVLINSGWGAF